MNIRDAFHSTVHNAPGGCEALAIRLGMSPVILRNKANPASDTNKPMIDDIDRIMGLTADYQFLHALASNHGYVCVKVDGEICASDMAVLEVVTQGLSAHGGVGAAVYAALADGRVDATELKAIEKAVFDTHRALEELRARMSSMAEKS